MPPPDPRPELIPCRIAACFESLDDGLSWSFYLINDSPEPFEEIVLYALDYEWGGAGNYSEVNIHIPNLAPNAHTLISRQDDECEELRISLFLRLKTDGRDVRFYCEFPKLRRYIDHSQEVSGLGKIGVESFPPVPMI